MLTPAATANAAPFSLSLQGVPPEAYAVRRWRYEAALPIWASPCAVMDEVR